MILSIKGQFALFLFAVFFGFAAGFLYDFIVIFRKIIKHYKFFIHLEDFFYWVFLAIFLFFIMLEENNGDIRGFLILGTFIGMIIYSFSLSGIFLKASDKILYLIKRFILFVFKLFFIPLECVFELFKKIFLFLFRRK